MSDDDRRDEPWYEYMEEDEDYKYIDIISIAAWAIVIAFFAVCVWIVF